MRWNLKRDVISIFVPITAIVITLILYPSLPERIPTHFNIEGIPDRYDSKFVYFFWYNVMLSGIYILMTFIPMIDPFWKKIKKRYNLFLIFRDIILFFMFFVFILSIKAMKSGKLDVGWMGIGLGLLFILIGNYLPKIPRNFFFGIRVPWTLASEIVWKKTHIMGGWVFVLAGLLMMILSFSKITLFITVMISTGIILVFSILYPFFLYKKLEKQRKIKTPEL